MHSITILKYPLADWQGNIERFGKLPAGEVVAVAFQRGVPSVWIEFETDARGRYDDTRSRDYALLPTGGNHKFLDDDMQHIGSAVSDDTVWHLYADKNYL